MSDDLVTLVYVGPHADGVIESQYDESKYPFTAGEPVDVPAWLAFGHPGEPGQYVDADGERHDFTRLAELDEAGAVDVVVERIPPHQSLLDQVDNWRLADSADWRRFASWRVENDLRTFHPRKYALDPDEEQIRVDLIELAHHAALEEANTGHVAPPPATPADPPARTDSPDSTPKTDQDGES